VEILFLGTGAAWAVPEHSCECLICKRMMELGEERTRTSFLVRGPEKILVDCGPDFRLQMRRNALERPDLVLITHEHGDHYLGLDDLLAFRRCTPRAAWRPIPVYATQQTWDAVEQRFGYLVGSLIEKRKAVPGEPLSGIKTRVLPFSTFHGPSAPGSVGYFIQDRSGAGTSSVLYTSDFMSLPEEPSFLLEPDVLVVQSHWLNEPRNNRPHHMSFQCALEYIRRWKPVKATYLVHLSDGDQVAADPCNDYLKKLDPMSPLKHPLSGDTYPVPLCQAQWQDVVDRIAGDMGIPQPVVVAQDGLSAVV